jgi:hypothetical protein
VALPEFVDLWPLLVFPYLLAAERIVKHVLRYHERLLDHQVECRVLEKEGSQGLLNVAELERARRHKRRRLRLPTTKSKEDGTPQKSLPANPVDDRPDA